MSKKIICSGLVDVIVVLMLSLSAYGQGVYEAWVARYNGPGNYDDEATAIAVDDSGNVYITGSSWAGPSRRDYATIKYSPNGDTLWVRRFNGAVNDDDFPHALVLDNAGNVLVTGSSYMQVGNPDFGTVKYNPNGDVMWSRTYDGPGRDIDIAYDMAVDNQDNVYVTGLSHGGGVLAYEIATIRYSAAGDELWVKRFNLGPGAGDGGGRAIAIDKLGNVVVTGEIRNGPASLDYATIKYNPDGETLWVRLYNGPAIDFHLDAPRDLAVDDAGNVYVTGISWGGSTHYDIATIKYSPVGDLLWVRRYDDPFNRDDDPSGIAVDSEGDVYVAGTSGALSAWSEYVVIKYSPQGENLWARRYSTETTVSSIDGATALVLDNAGGAFVTGATTVSGRGNDIGTLRYNPNGNLDWVRLYNFESSSSEQPYDIALDKYGNVYVTGFTDRDTLNHDFVTIKYSPCTETNPRTGDLNKDNKVDLIDVVYLVNIVCRSWAIPSPSCLADVNGDGNVTLGDALYLFNYYFRQGPAPRFPGACCR